MKRILITGANSGLGLEFANRIIREEEFQLVVGCRTPEKVSELLQQPNFVHSPSTLGLVCDLHDYESLVQSVATLPSSSIDILVCNAGALYIDKLLNKNGLEATMAGNLVGHHVLISELLKQGKFNVESRCLVLVVSGEMGQGNFPGMPILPRTHYEEDFVRNLRGDFPHPFNGLEQYATCLHYQTLYGWALAKRFSQQLQVICVSPGNVPNTGIQRDIPWAVKFVVNAGMRLFQGEHTVAEGVQRYMDVLLDPSRFDSGQFYASPEGSLIGPLVLQALPQGVTSEDVDKESEALLSAMEQFWPME